MVLGAVTDDSVPSLGHCLEGGGSAVGARLKVHSEQTDFLWQGKEESK